MGWAEQDGGSRIDRFSRAVPSMVSTDPPKWQVAHKLLVTLENDGVQVLALDPAGVAWLRPAEVRELELALAAARAHLREQPVAATPSTDPDQKEHPRGG